MSWLHRTAILATLLVALGSVSTTHGAPAIADEVLLSRIGRFVLGETSAGRAVLERALGSPIRTTTAKEFEATVRALRKSSDPKIASELEARVRAIDSRFRLERRGGIRQRPERLAAEDKALIDQWSREALKFRLSPRGEIEFSSNQTFADSRYRVTRDQFLNDRRNTTHPASSAPSILNDPQLLSERYHVKKEDVLLSPEHGWPGVVIGAAPQEMASVPAGSILPHPGGAVDEVIVGSGPAGLTSGLLLSDANHKVLILESAGRLGGLATGGKIGSARFGSGAAYYAPPAKGQFRIMQRLGLNNYTKLNQIKKNVDSLLLDGVLYREFWEDPMIDHLPASFKLYKHCVQRMEAQGLIGNQPIEEHVNLTLDRYFAADVVRSMPEMVSKWDDAASKEIYRRFLEDPRIDRADPMRHVFAYLNPYGRSALGTTTEQLNAMAFFNFQASELKPRFTGDAGTGELSDRFIALFKKRPEFVSMQASSPVVKIIKHPDYVEVIYARGGKYYSVRAKNVVFSAPMKIAPKLIQDFEALAPEHAAALRKIPYTDYIVTNVETEGHVTEGTYDFWLGNTRNDELWPTDVIDGRFKELGTRKGGDQVGVLTIYQPIGEGGISRFVPSELFARAEQGVDRVEEMLGPYLKMTWGTEIKPKWMIANVYPDSIQIVKPGYFQDIAPIFRKPIAGAIYPAGIVNGTPSVEEAFYSGQRAAEDILKKTLTHGGGK